MTATVCQNCGRQTQLYLCAECETELGDMLHGLSHNRWIEYLEDAALGRTRLGESARRSTENSTPLPVNLAASHLLHTVQETLLRWVQTCLAKGTG